MPLSRDEGSLIDRRVLARLTTLRTPIPLLLTMALALTACGGQLEPMPRRADAVAAPVVVEQESPVALLADPAAARARQEAVLARSPDALAALNDLALTYLAESRPESARALLDEVVVRGGPREQQTALVNLAAVYAREGYLTAAVAHAEAARDVDPTRPEPHYLLALVAAARGDRALALSRVRDALRVDEGERARAALVFLEPSARRDLDLLVSLAVTGDRRADTR
jgi:tetratricopeptide (TPR) repeat protein